MRACNTSQLSENNQPGEYLVELGGWFDHLASAELRSVAAGRVDFVGHRLARVAGSPEELLRLGGSRAVHAARGVTERASRIPDELVARLRGTFALRFHDPRHLLSEPDRRRVISLTWRAHPSPSVDLVHPSHEIHVFVETNGVWFGERVGECAPELRSKAVRRSFFRSYETPPRKARVLVNLSGAGPDRRFIDPFCGTGALVLEAERVGCRAVGSDLDPSAVAGAVLNGREGGFRASFLMADARRLPAPLEAFGCGATDMPYGHSASLRGTPGRQLYTEVLHRLSDVVVPGGRVVVMSLDTDQPRADPNGWALEWRCREETRTLVRAVCVWRKS